MTTKELRMRIGGILCDPAADRAVEGVLAWMDAMEQRVSDLENKSRRLGA